MWTPVGLALEVCNREQEFLFSIQFFPRESGTNENDMVQFGSVNGMGILHKLGGNGTQKLFNRIPADLSLCCGHVTS